MDPTPRDVRYRAPRWLALAVTVAVVLSAVAVGALALSASGAPGGGMPGHLLSSDPGATAPLADPAAYPPVVVASVPVGSLPVAAAVDPTNGWVYVVNSGSENVSVLSGTTVLATIDLAPLGAPSYDVYDPANGYVYVVDQYDFEATAGAVTVIDGTSAVANLTVGRLPTFALVDPVNGSVYVTNSGSANVSVLSGLALLATVPTGSGPCAAAFDAADGDVYVANAASGDVSVLNGTRVVGTLAAGVRPLSVAYDPLDASVYVVNGASQNVTVYADGSLVGSVPAGSGPSFVAFDPTVDGVEVANTNSSNLTVLAGLSATGTVPVGAGPVWLGVDPSGVYTDVANAYANSVTVLNGTAVVRTLAVGAVPVFGVADARNGFEYLVDSGSDNVTVLAPTYPVVFSETGLAPATAWSVTLAGIGNGSATGSIGFLEPSGSYAYTIGTPVGYALVGSVPASPLSVAGEALGVAVTFAAVPSTVYTLTFTETGLGANCSGQTGAGAQGHGGCCMGAAPSWSVTVAGLTQVTTNRSISFEEGDGTYDYTIAAPEGYTVASATPGSPVTIDGANETVAVRFVATVVAPALAVTFQETGLPAGTGWCVTLNGTECSSGRTIVFGGLPAGDYAFNVSAVPGYSATPPAGTVTLSHRDVRVTIRFGSSSSHHCMEPAAASP